MSRKDASITRQETDVSDVYDHAINLVDTTVSTEQSGNGKPFASTSQKGPGWKDLARIPTRGSDNRHLTKKFAKYQEGRPSAEQERQDERGESSKVPRESLEGEALPPTKPSVTSQVEETDFAETAPSGERERPETIQEAQKTVAPTDMAPTTSKKANHQKDELHEIDILYENQRGWFVFGIPLYSHSSLLNFDPAPWVTKDLKDSAVNITNAQLPDPTWEWAWKSWYVDMSHDVDEEGWQYSFMFSNKFSWHGTHPWPHSFVRRRRWLRKRIKRHHSHLDGKTEKADPAHMLTSEYFTIHQRRTRSHSTDRNTNARSSYISTSSAAVEEKSIPPEEIINVPSLIKELKYATVDREKIDAVRRFVTQGGDELIYLKDAIPEIMSFFIFQASRRQLLSYLKSAADQASKHRQDVHSDQDNPESTEEQRRADNLIAAAEVSEKQITGLEYWSDRKHILETADQNDNGYPGDNERTNTAVSREAQQTRHDNPMATDKIKGIPDKAAVSFDPTHQVIHSTHDGTQDEDHDGETEELEEKDKEKVEDEVENEEKEGEPETGEEIEEPKQLPKDAMRTMPAVD